MNRKKAAELLCVNQGELAELLGITASHLSTLTELKDQNLTIFNKETDIRELKRQVSELKATIETMIFAISKGESDIARAKDSGL